MIDYKEKVYSVYVLIKNKKPTYIGQTSDIEKRIIKHKKTKDFDSYFILLRTNNKKEALKVEINLIRYNKAFGVDITNKVGGFRDFMVSHNTFYINKKSEIIDKVQFVIVDNE